MPPFPKTLHLCRQQARSSLLTVILSFGLLGTPTPAAAQIVPVCDRTPEVRDEIVRLVPGIDDCADVTEAHLAAIEGEFFHTGWYDALPTWGGGPYLHRSPPPQVEELRVGDFSGLSSVTNLYLDRTPLADLPGGIFAGLSSLEVLTLDRTHLSTLPEKIFSGLSSLEELHLDETQLSTLPVGVFSGLAALKTLDLSSNQLNHLPPGVFAGLSSLEELSLSHNQLTHLPAGIFSGLFSLRHLILFDNPLTHLPVGVFSGLSNLVEVRAGGGSRPPLPIHVSLESAGRGRFKAKAHTGAPFDDD